MLSELVIPNYFNGDGHLIICNSVVIKNLLIQRTEALCAQALEVQPNRRKIRCQIFRTKAVINFIESFEFTDYLLQENCLPFSIGCLFNTILNRIIIRLLSRLWPPFTPFPELDKTNHFYSCGTCLRAFTQNFSLQHQFVYCVGCRNGHSCIRNITHTIYSEVKHSFAYFQLSNNKEEIKSFADTIVKIIAEEERSIQGCNTFCPINSFRREEI